jgi:hypothetical protein
MKKTFIFISSLCIANVCFAQLKVQDNGRVGVGVSASTTLLSKFSVGSVGWADAIVGIGSGAYLYGLKVEVGGNGSKYGIYSTASVCGTSGTAIGIWGQGEYNSGIGCHFMGIGVRGLSGSTNATLTGAYGVSGLIVGNKGASIYGAFGSTETPIPTGLYAGYFDGNVVVTGTVTGTIISSSDSRLKSNILNIDYQQTLDKLLKLRPVEYSMQQVWFDADSTDQNGNAITYKVQRYNETSQVFQKTHYGLLAQEVKEILPDLVYEGSDGYLGIDYTSLVPMLLKVVQQQQTEIENLKQQRNNAPARTTDNSTNRNAELFQNAPNPFSENSEIGFYLPENVKNAMLCVYDMNGRQLSQTVIKERGNSTFVINGRSYGAGMYLYSLIADNQVIDTKRMILTK